MPSLRQKISLGRYEEAVVELETIGTRLSLNTISSTKRVKHGFLNALLLDIKIPHSSTREINFQAYKKIRKTYYRLLLFREMLTGETFYLITEKKEEATRLFPTDDIALGENYVLYQPRMEKRDLHGVKVLETQTVLLHVSRKFVGSMLNSISDCLKGGETKVKSFLVKGNLSVDVEEVVVAGCNHRFCDGRHLSEEGCCSLQCVSRSYHYQQLVALQMKVLLPGYDEWLGYRSVEIGKILLPKALLVAEVHKEVMGNELHKQIKKYKDAEVMFLFAGWVKVSQDEEEKDVIGPIRISAIYPTHILEVEEFKGVIQPESESGEEIICSPLKSLMRRGPERVRTIAPPLNILGGSLI